jgi:hypothetical protein
VELFGHVAAVVDPALVYMFVDEVPVVDIDPPAELEFEVCDGVVEAVVVGYALVRLKVKFVFCGAKS